MAKLNLSNTISAQVAELFNKALTSKSAVGLIGLQLTIDSTSTLEVDINGNTTKALLGWVIPGQEAKEVWTSWLTRRGSDFETGQIYSNKFTINDESVLLPPQEVVNIVMTNDILLEDVEYHHISEPEFNSSGKRIGERSVKRPFFTWRVLPRREIPPMSEWSQEVLSRISQNDPSPAEEQPTPKKAAVSQDDTSDDVPF